MDFDGIMGKAEAQYQRELDGYVSVESVFKTSAESNQAIVSDLLLYCTTLYYTQDKHILNLNKHNFSDLVNLVLAYFLDE